MLPGCFKDALSVLIECSFYIQCSRIVQGSLQHFRVLKLFWYASGIIEIIKWWVKQASRTISGSVPFLQLVSPYEGIVCPQKINQIIGATLSTMLKWIRIELPKFGSEEGWEVSWNLSVNISTHKNMMTTHKALIN